MKKILILLIGVLSALVLITTSCDKIEGPYKETGGSGVTGDTVRKLLFEDYTGHQCVNCPSAHVTIAELHQVYGDRMVTVAIHTSSFADMSFPPYDADYKTADGEELSLFFGGTTAPLPKGMVNRTKVNGSYLIEKAEFGTEVSKVLDSLDEKPDLYIEIKPVFSGGSTFDLEVKITAMKDMPAGKYNLSVLITESDIISAQMNIDPNINNGDDVMDYHHNHVLRGAANTAWGEEFATSISNGQTYTKSYTNIPFDAEWNADNISIVAFAYFADGPNEKSVIQAQEVKLK
ncbi:MAG: hypothetical protein DRI86_06585 [Bacteroidetes bacterium]|nr:MAG: hypothetical protein DRI86_06585 [Bacteroidota bacterium]